MLYEVITLTKMHSGKPLGLSVEHGPVNSLQRYGKAVHVESLLLNLRRAEPHLGDLRIGVRTAGHDQRRDLLPSEKEGVGDENSRLGISYNFV